MKDIKEYLKAGTSRSMMRLAMNRAVWTVVIVAIITILGAVIGFIIGVIFDRDLPGIAACIGALAGVSGAIIGTLAFPAFGGKAMQSKFEQPNKDNGEGK